MQVGPYYGRGLHWRLFPPPPFSTPPYHRKVLEMSLIGIIFNVLSIIIVGDYAPHIVSDGPFMNEDSLFYMPFYELARALGSIR